MCKRPEKANSTRKRENKRGSDKVGGEIRVDAVMRLTSTSEASRIIILIAER